VKLCIAFQIWIADFRMDFHIEASIRQKFFVDRVINVWNALPSTVNFASLNVLGTSLKRLISLVSRL